MKSEIFTQWKGPSQIETLVGQQSGSEKSYGHLKRATVSEGFFSNAAARLEGEPLRCKDSNHRALPPQPLRQRAFVSKTKSWVICRTANVVDIRIPSVLLPSVLLPAARRLPFLGIRVPSYVQNLLPLALLVLCSGKPKQERYFDTLLSSRVRPVMTPVYSFCDWSRPLPLTRSLPWLESTPI